MTHKLVINVDTNKPLSEYGDRHVILYNKEKNEYYVTTREQFLREQDNKIKNLEQNFSDFKQEVANFMENIRKEHVEFQRKQKETNTKIIQMVKPLVTEEK